MADITKIHADKQPVRRHFLNEWLSAKGMEPMDLLRALNDEERSINLAAIDKSQIYRWLKGQLPQEEMQVRIAGVLDLDDPAQLLRPPEADWLMKFFEKRNADERARIRQMLEAAFPEKTGTEE